VTESLGRKHPLAECERCPYKTIGKYVPSLFPTKPIKLSVVGEAPGPQEARTGIPFTGPSGDLLNAVLKHHGVAREEVFLTNICSCRPSGPTEAPPKDAIAACANRLNREIDGVLPRTGEARSTIVAVGGTAAKALLDDNRRISSLRVGPPKPSPHRDDVEIIATWHPAFCLRSPDAFPSFVRDIGKINGVKHGPWVEPEYKVFDDPSVALLALQRLIERVRLVVVDIEVGIEKDFNYAHPEDYALLCVGIAYTKGKAVVLGENSLKDRRVLDKLRELLSRVKVVAHNGKFDLRGLSPVVGVQQLWFDTMLASYAIDERPGQHGLKVLAIERLGAPAYDDDVKQYVGKGKGKSYGNIPRPILYQYNAYDVCCTWDLYELFAIELGERGRQAHDFMVAAANELIYLELAGIHFDHDYSADLAEEYLERINDTEKEIVDTVGYYVNPRSPKQIQAYLLKKGIRTKTTNKDFLAEIRPFMTDTKEEVGRFIDVLSKNRKASKLYGTYIKGLSQRTTHGNIYTTYLLHGTTSGRLASRNPNMQNIVRNKPIRNQFTVASGDNVLIQLDYKQAEGRVITTLAQDEYLRDIFQDPTRDIFDELTERVYGAGNWAKEERVKIKTFFYGLSYGREAPSIAREFDMPLDEAHELLSSFKNLIPATVAWQSAISHKVLSGEDLITPFGRKRSFHLITDENKRDVLNEALSFLPQSIASDICLSALVRLRPMLVGLATLRLTIHDAIVTECHKDRSSEVIEVMKKEMIAAGERFTDYVPFAVDSTIGTRLGQL